MYEDKLDGQIANGYSHSEARRCVRHRRPSCASWRPTSHQTSNRSYIEGVQLLELAHRAAAQFESQPPAEKRKLLNYRTLELHLERRRTRRKISTTP